MDRAATAEDTAQLVADLRHASYTCVLLTPNRVPTGWVEMLNDAADALEAAQSPQEPAQATSTALCGKRDSASRTAAPCDRPAAHTGDCSWKSARRLRMLQEYQDEAHEARRLGVDNDRLNRENTRLKRDLDYLSHHTRPWWQRIFGKSGPTP